MSTSHSGLFDASPIAGELAAARKQSRQMVSGITGMFGPFGQVTTAHLPFLAFIVDPRLFRWARFR